MYFQEVFVMMLKRYYALEQFHGNVSTTSSWGRPQLHIFYSKKERDDFVKNYLGEGINNYAVKTDSKIAKSSYSHTVDGAREWDEDVTIHSYCYA